LIDAELKRKPSLRGARADSPPVQLLALKSLQFPLLNFMCFDMMTNIMKPAKPWRADLERQDILRITAHPPGCICSIHQTLSEHLCLLSYTTLMTNDKLTDIIAPSRAWSDVFGSQFLAHLLNRSIGKTARILVPQDTRNLV
jgi:hypothetical protein